MPHLLAPERTIGRIVRTGTPRSRSGRSVRREYHDRRQGSRTYSPLHCYDRQKVAAIAEAQSQRSIQIKIPGRTPIGDQSAITRATIGFVVVFSGRTPSPTVRSHKERISSAQLRVPRLEVSVSIALAIHVIKPDLAPIAHHAVRLRPKGRHPAAGLWSRTKHRSAALSMIVAHLIPTTEMSHSELAGVWWAYRQRPPPS